MRKELKEKIGVSLIGGVIFVGIKATQSLCASKSKSEKNQGTIRGKVYGAIAKGLSYIASALTTAVSLFGAVSLVM